MLAGIPEFPAAADYLWEWFQRLHMRRAAVTEGAAPITWEAMAGWRLLTGVDPAPWEIELIEKLDLLWRHISTDKQYEPEWVTALREGT